MTDNQLPFKRMNDMDSSPLQTTNRLNGLNESSLAQFSWNNDNEYLEDIRKQIRKELPNIGKDELERIVRDFQSQDAINVTVSPISEFEQQVADHQITDAQVQNETKMMKKMGGRIGPEAKGKSNGKFEVRNDLNSAQSQPAIRKDNFTYKSHNSRMNFRRANENRKFNKVKMEHENCNQTRTVENDELNSKILNQINSLLEQQFRSLKNELKANQSSSTEASSMDTVLRDLESNLEADLESGELKTKIKSSYIPENVYNIAQVDGIKRVIQKPFTSNILAQKKFMNAFKSASMSVDDSTRLDNTRLGEETVSTNQQISKTKKDKFNLDDEDAKLNIGDYDSLY